MAEGEVSGAELLASIVPAGMLRRIDAACPDVNRDALARLMIEKGTEAVMPVLVALFPDK